MKTMTFIRKLLPYADKDLVFSVGSCSIKRLPGPRPIDDENDVISSGIYVLSDNIEIHLEVDSDN